MTCVDLGLKTTDWCYATSFSKLDQLDFQGTHWWHLVVRLRRKSAYINYTQGSAPVCREKEPPSKELISRMTARRQCIVICAHWSPAVLYFVLDTSGLSHCPKSARIKDMSIHPVLSDSFSPKYQHRHVIYEFKLWHNSWPCKHMMIPQNL